MALRVWLPLNGNLENKGISDYEIRSANITIADDGKIGKCYSFNGSNSYINITNFEIGNNWSYGCWVNTPNSDSRGWEIVMILNNSGSDADSQFAFWVHQKENRFESLANTQYVSTIPYTNYYNNWHHFFATFNGTLLTTYIDGNVVNTKTITATQYNAVNLTIGARSTNAAGTSFASWFQGKLNDIRVYDHCLSPLEVKEISQGLVLHYKLDGFSGGAGENLLKGNYHVSTVGSVNSSAGSLALDTDLMPLSSLPGKTFTFTYDYSIEGSKLYNNTGDFTKDRYGIHLSYSYTNGSNTSTAYPGAGYLTVSGTGRAVQTFTIPSNITVNSFNFGIQPYNKPADGNNNIWYLKNVKLEEGNIDTGWSLNHNDSGIVLTKIVDSSGYGNDGIINVIPKIQNNGLRYSNNTLLDKKKISCNSGFVVGDDPAFTVSFWFKLYSNITYTSYADLISFTTNSYSSQPFRLELCGSPAGTNLMWFRGPSGSSGGFTVGPSSSGWYSLDEWHHIALVSIGNKQYISYFDGQQRNTYNGSSNTWTPTGGLSIGDTLEGTANISDVRIYATALSAEDILNLYHTPASIDNLGGIHGFEMVEDTSSRELLALPWTSACSIHNKTSISTNYNDKHEWYSNTNSSAGSDYIKINPTGKTYYWDTEVSIAAGNQFYIGFERYDANKTSRSNNACVYVIATKPTSDIVHQRYSGVVNLATDGVNPTDTITLRILNAWSGTDSGSTKEATIHYLSLREATEKPKTGKVKQQGQIYTDEFVERKKQASIYENGFVGGNTFIEK